MFTRLLLSFCLIHLAACTSSPEPGSVRQRAKSNVDERVQLRKVEDEVPEKQPPEALSADELKARLQSCFDAMISQDAHEVRLCFTRDAKAIHADASQVHQGPSDIVNVLYQPAWSALPDLRGGAELVLMRGTDVAVMAWGKGTHTEELSGFSPTEKVVATNSLKILQLANDGRIKFEASYSDALRVLGQLGESRLPFRPAFEKAPEEKGWFVATGSEGEKANEKVAEAFTQALADHKVSAFQNLMIQNVVLVDYALPEDLQGLEAIKAEFKELLGAFSKLNIKNRLRWAAGAYVLQLLTFEGQNDGSWARYDWEANKRKLKVNVGFMLRMKEGKIEAMWRFWDSQIALERMGLQILKKP